MNAAETAPAPTEAPPVEPQTRLALHPLSIREEEGECVVGRMETGRFITMPLIGARAIRLLQEGLSVKEAEERLARDENAEVDMAAFVAGLVEYGFVSRVGDRLLGDDGALKPNLAWLKARHVSWLFQLPAKVACAALFAAGLWALARLRWMPHYPDFFWVPSTSITIAVNTAMFAVTMAMHELMHLIAARSLGVPARISFSTRLHNLVVQTDVTGLWSVPRERRYRVYCAGMISDGCVIAVSALLVAYAPLPPLCHSLLRALILMCFMGLCWQLEFFMRTDVYFVAMDLLRCKNLYESSLASLKHRAARLWQLLARRPATADPLEALPPRERLRVRIYSYFVLVGSAWTLGVAAFLGLPIMIEMFLRAGVSVFRGVAERDAWAFSDGMVTIVIEGGLQVLFVITFLKNRRPWLAALRRRLFAS